MYNLLPLTQLIFFFFFVEKWFGLKLILLIQFKQHSNSVDCKISVRKIMLWVKLNYNFPGAEFTKGINQGSTLRF